MPRGIVTIFGYIPELHACIQYNNIIIMTWSRYNVVISAHNCFYSIQGKQWCTPHVNILYLVTVYVFKTYLSAQRFTIYLYSQKLVNLTSCCCSFTLLCLAILLFLIYPSFVTLIVGNTKLMMQCELLNTNDTSVG